MQQLNVLVACEESQAVCKAFRELGHNAFSCDLQNCSGGFPEWHIIDDVINYINGNCEFYTCTMQHYYINKWNLIIAHPPCTYLSNAGARWLYKDKKLNLDRYKKGLLGKEFFMKFYFADCDHICIENPLPSKIYSLPIYDQIIQPYLFGEPWSKKTCLWLKGLPNLVPTDILSEYIPYCTSGSYKKYHDDKYKGVSRIGGAAKIRSKTFPKVAYAMALQWSDYILKEVII